MIYFDHEKLEVYQEAIKFASWTDLLLSNNSIKSPLKQKFDKSSFAIPLNIAEGTAKTSNRDRSRFFRFSRQGAHVSSACLDICYIRNAISNEEARYGKATLVKIVQMLVKLIQSRRNRISDQNEIYNLDETLDHESLDLYRKALLFMDWGNSILTCDDSSAEKREQYDRASISILTNIARATGFKPGDGREKCLKDARGSAVECAGVIDVHRENKWLDQSYVDKGKKILQEIVKMLVGWINK